MSEYAAQLEPDLLRYYGLDIALLGTEGFTYRRLDVLLQALPSDSLTVRAIQGPIADWDTKDHLLATVVDELRTLWYAYVAGHTKPNKRPPKPKMVVRPGLENKGKRKLSMAEMQERLHNTKWVDAGVDRVVE